MARPHIEFIQAQRLAWTPLPADGPRPGALAKILSEDTDSGAFSAIIRYPAGWAMPPFKPRAQDEELFVLDGALVIDGVSYAAGDYAYLPARGAPAAMDSAGGADVLTFFEAPAPPRAAVRKLSTAAMPWGAPTDPVVAAMACAPGRKQLRADKETGERTWLLKMGPDDPAATTHGRTEIHPVAEETFLLEGEISMPCGVLRQGAYFWRPANVPHGPSGTRTGLVGFFRCKGGPLTTAWSEDRRPIPWDAPYAPVLPEDLRARLHAEGDLGRKY